MFFFLKKRQENHKKKGFLSLPNQNPWKRREKRNSSQGRRKQKKKQEIQKKKKKRKKKKNKERRRAGIYQSRCMRREGFLPWQHPWSWGRHSWHLAVGESGHRHVPFSSLVAPYCAIPRDYLSNTPLLRAMGFLVSQHGQLGAIPPPEGPGIEKIHSRSNAWKNHSPTHEIFILLKFSFSVWKFHSRLKISIPGPVFLRPERGPEWKFHSRLKISFRIESLIFSILPLEIEFFQSEGHFYFSANFFPFSDFGPFSILYQADWLAIL